VTRLSRSTFAEAREADPIRIVHIGPGAFHRAHCAWYTERAGDRWGIAVAGSRGTGYIDVLGPQDGLYSLVERGGGVAAYSVVQSIAAVVDASGSALTSLVSSAEVAVITMTVTETGYRPGSPVLGRLARALCERVACHDAPIACCSLDNLASNGAVLGSSIRALVADRAPGLLDRFDASVSFPSSVVDRITPRPTPADRALAEQWLGLVDEAAVSTEAYSEWVFEDRFPGGRPAWEQAGAQPVGDLRPFEARKLRILNAGHSALAYLGAPRGARTVDEALRDTEISEALRALWAEALPTLSPAADGERYCALVRQRFAEAGVGHALAQIAADGAAKLAVRVAPTMLDLRRRGQMPLQALSVVAAFWSHLRGDSGLPVSPADGVLAARCQGSAPAAARALLAALAPELADDDEVVRALTALGSERRR
jgi:fructuronate reductase